VAREVLVTRGFTFMGAATSIENDGKGKYLDPMPMHNRPDGLFRWLTTRWYGVHHSKPDNYAYTLYGEYHQDELAPGARMESMPLKAGDMWEVPITTDGHAMFAGYKWAPEGQPHDNYQIKVIRIGENTTLDFYPLTGPNRDTKVKTWRMVPSINDSYQGRYLNEYGFYRFLRKGESAGIRRTWDNTVEYTLSGIYHDSELVGRSRGRPRNWVPPLPAWWSNSVPLEEEVIFAGATGPNAPTVNGVFKRAAELANGKRVFLKAGDVTLCLWCGPDNYWYLGDVQKKDANVAGGYAHSTEAGMALPTDASGWKVYDDAAYVAQPAATCVTATEEQAAGGGGAAGQRGHPDPRFPQIVQVGDQWHVPVHSNDIAEFARNKAAQQGHFLENCRIEPAQDSEGTKQLIFYSNEETTYNKKVATWTRAPVDAVIDLATAKSTWIGEHNQISAAKAQKLQQRLKDRRKHLSLPTTERGWINRACPTVAKCIFYVQVGRNVVDDEQSGKTSSESESESESESGPPPPSYELCIDGTGEPLADGLTRVYVVASMWRSKQEGNPTTWLNISLDVIDTYRAENMYGLKDIARKYVAPPGYETSLKIAAYDLARELVGQDTFWSRMFGSTQSTWWATEQGRLLTTNLFNGTSVFENSGERLVNIHVSFAECDEEGLHNDFSFLAEDELQHWNGGGFWYTTDASVKREIRDRLKRDSKPPGSVSLLGRGALYHWVLQYMAGVHRGESGPRLALTDAWQGYLKNDDKAKMAMKRKVDDWTEKDPLRHYRDRLKRLLDEIEKGTMGEVPQYTKSRYCSRRVTSADLQSAYDVIKPEELVGLGDIDLIDKVLYPLRVQVHVEQMTDHIDRYGIQTSNLLPTDRTRFARGIYDGYQMASPAFTRFGPYPRDLSQPDTVEASFAPATTAGAEAGRAQ